MSLQKHTLWSLAPLLVATLINLFSVPLFYRYLGPEMYALWFYVLTFTGAFGFMDLGLGVAVGRYVGIALSQKDSKAVREYWGTGHAIAAPMLALMAIGFVLIGVFFGPNWFQVSPENISLLKWSFVAGGAGLFLSYYSQQWMILAQAHLDFVFLSKLRIIVTVATILPSIYIAFCTRNPLHLIAWNASISFGQLIWLIIHARLNYQLGFNWTHFAKKRFQQMFSFTSKVFLDLLAAAFLGTIDRIVLGKWVSPVDFAHYNIATNVGSRLSGLSVAVMGPVFHNTNRAVGKDDTSHAAQIYNETFRFVFGWFLLASVWSFVWGRTFLNIWLGASVGAHVLPIFAPLVTAYVFISICNISNAQLGSLNRVGTGIAFRLGTAVLTVLLIWIGWQANGITGAAWGFLFSRIGCLAQDIFVIRLIKGGGWLSRDTWSQIFLQVGVGVVFLLVQKAVTMPLAAQSVLAVIHGLGIALFLLITVKRDNRIKSA